ncbi:MAG: pyridoxamine 5'-phosphate oxidase family protein [Oscillospiraceae bacterium]
MADFFNDAQNLLESCENIEVASVDEQGYPRVCVVTKLMSSGFDKIYFSTGASGTKTRHFNSNQKASVCYHDNKDSVTLVGKVEIVEDMELKQQIWQDWLFSHFKDGVNDSEFCLLKFKASEATFWIDGEFSTHKV